MKALDNYVKIETAILEYYYFFNEYRYLPK